MSIRKYSYQVAVAANQNIKERDYWLKKLSGNLVKTSIPYDFMRFRGTSDEIQMAALKFELSGELYSKLMVLSRGLDYTLHIVLVSGLVVLLGKYSGARDILIGSPIYKQDIDTEFINTILVLRNQITEEMSFKDLLLQVKQTVVEAVENQNYPILVLPERLNLPITQDENPLFDIALLLENIHNKRYLQNTDYTILFSFLSSTENIAGLLEYNSQLYLEDSIQRIGSHFVHLLEIVTADVNIRLGDINLLTEKEKEQILLNFNDNALEYPEDKTVHQLFAEQVERTPNNISVVGQSVADTAPGGLVHEMSYHELNRRADQLARVLQKKDVQPNSIVALMLFPCLEMTVALLGILKAGGAYLPIDPVAPTNRVASILVDSGAEMLITSHGLFMSDRISNDQKDLSTRSALSFRNLDFAFILSFEFLAEGQPQRLPLESLQPAACNLQPAGSLAYVIYTSGSTGKPKGVLVEHRNLVANIFAFYAEFEIKSMDTVIQLSDYTFDAFAEEMYPVLLRGGKVAIPGMDEYLNLQNLANFILMHKVNIIDCSPLLLNQLNKLDGLKGVHTIISGGDVLREDYVDRLAQVARVYNTYGPSETTVCVTYYCYNYHKESSPSIPIGKPIANYKVYILDDHQRPLPIGVVGEICVAGPGVTLGYLNQPGLTSENFVDFSRYKDLPLASTFKTKHLTLYKTGDFGRWLADGSIEFSGRQDQQVKIRGFRIETGEIETLLQQKAGIKESVVIAREDKSGDKYLCAYFVTNATKEGGMEVDPSGLREYLQKELPDFMIPAFFVKMAGLPLTSSGKVDKQALPEPDVKALVKYVEPRNEVEKRIQEIWLEIFDLERIGINDNFFEIGGHSLKATVMISRIQKTFNVALPLTEIFRTPTIKHLAKYIQDAASEKGVESLTDANLSLLRKGTLASSHIFLVHGGSGTVEQYTEFCRRLHPELNCWGLKADHLEDYTPRNLTIEGVAQKYIGEIKKVQSRGPYRIAGWCIGGTIAFEMVRQLEQRQEAINLFAIINSPPPDQERSRNTVDITLESELDAIPRGLLNEQLEQSLKKVSQLKELWSIVIDHLEHRETLEMLRNNLPEFIKKEIPNFEQQDIKGIIYYLNMNKTFDCARNRYIPGEKIKTPGHIFSARGTRIFDIEKWNHYCVRSMKFYEVEGDHFSIFSIPEVENFARLFNNIM